MEKGKAGLIDWNDKEHTKVHQTPEGRIQTHHCGHRTVRVSGVEYLYDTFTTHPYGNEEELLGSDVYVYRLRRRLPNGTVEVEYIGRLSEMPKDVECAILDDTFNPRS